MNKLSRLSHLSKLLIAGLVLVLAALACTTELRIEHKFSRYREDSVVATINGAGDAGVELDSETAALIDYAAKCYELSEGRFDITSGVLRRAWRFDGSDRLPEPVKEWLERIQSSVMVSVS